MEPRTPFLQKQNDEKTKPFFGFQFRIEPDIQKRKRKSLRFKKEKLEGEIETNKGQTFSKKKKCTATRFQNKNLPLRDRVFLDRFESISIHSLVL